MRLEELGEFGLIEKIKQLVGSESKDLIVGIDDDAAAYRLSENQVLLLTTDALIEGIHFNLDYFNFYQLGWRAMAVNLSDIAAMGGQADLALITLGLPSDLEVQAVEDFYRGIKTWTEKLSIEIAGGDTTKSPGPVFINMALIGHVESSRLTLRSGAKVGDLLYVTGTLGDAKAGMKVLQTMNEESQKPFKEIIRRHLTPEPRIDEARWLVENIKVHAMIDISDGLASEVHHICRLSHVGAQIWRSHIPLSRAVQQVAKNFNEDPVDYALYGGEDYEILFTVPSSEKQKLEKSFYQKFQKSCYQVGTVVSAEEGITILDRQGKKISLPFGGYKHF